MSWYGVHMLVTHNIIMVKINIVLSKYIMPNNWSLKEVFFEGQADLGDLKEKK